MRELIEVLWPELVHKLPPKEAVLPKRSKKNPARAGQVPRERNSRTAGGIGGSGSRPARLKGLVAFCRFEVQSAAPTLEAAKADFEASWRQWLAWAKLKEVH
jgi:hypothetical protein